MSAIEHYEPHPLALIFPAMDAEALGKMAADIEQNGQRDPIVLYEGKILDGVQRQAACEKANVTPSYSHWDNLPEWKRKGGPLAFVISENLHRRHMTIGQRAEIAEGLATGTHGGDRKSDQEQEIAFDRPTIKQAAAMMHVSDESVKQVRKVKREAPEKIKAIKAGKLAPSKAVRQIEQKKRERKGKLLNGEDASKVFDRNEFDEKVRNRWKKSFVDHFDKKRKIEVLQIVTGELFGIFYRPAQAQCSPKSVTYEDGTQFEIEKVLRDRHKLRLQSDNVAPLQPKSLSDWTAATGHAT